MNEQEARLVRAMADEAASRDVDAQALLAATRDRLEHAQPPRRRRLAPAIAAAAAVALVAGGIAAAVTLDDDKSPGVTASAAEVDREFTCPDRVQVDVSGAQDEFLPHLDGREPKDVAREYGAPRWEFVEKGTSAQLFLGNEDGTLGSIARYDREGGDWVLREATACGNGSPEAPTAEGMRLGRHGGEPHPARGVLNVGDPGTEPVLVDDRPVYDYSGLVLRHRSIYAAPCGRRLCLGIGEPDSGVHEDIEPSTPGSTLTLLDMCHFFVPDDLVGRESPYRVIGVWDPTGTSTDMRAGTALATSIAELTDLDDLTELETVAIGQVLTHPSWGDGKLWMAVVPAHDYYGVVVSLLVGDQPPIFSSLTTACDRTN